jgi:hypothetical protein
MSQDSEKKMKISGETILTLARDYAIPLGLRSMWKTDHDDDLIYCK